MEKQSYGMKPTCREIHHLVSEGMDRNLSLMERVRLRLHLLVCIGCSRFNGQMVLLRCAMRAFPMDGTPKRDRP